MNRHLQDSTEKAHKPACCPGMVCVMLVKCQHRSWVVCWWSNLHSSVLYITHAGHTSEPSQMRWVTQLMNVNILEMGLWITRACVCVCVWVCDRWPICIDRTPIKKLQWEGRGLLAGERGEGPEFGPASWLGEVWIGVGSVVLSQQMAGLVLLGSPDGFSTGAHSNTPEYPRTSGLHFRAAS